MFILFGVLSVLCFIYFISIVTYAGLGAAFSWFWLMAGVTFAGLGILFFVNKRIHFIEKINKVVLGGILGIVAIGVIIFSILLGCVISGMTSKASADADYIIVLGAQIKGERITKPLAKRLEAAYDYAIENEKVIIIVSGGKGDGEDISEAEAMKKYLIEKGISKDRILMEDESRNTYQNIKFSYKIICDRNDEKANILICSNNFHIFRAVKLAKSAGIENVEGLAAGSDNKLLLSYMVRECVGLVKELATGNIK